MVWQAIVQRARFAWACAGPGRRAVVGVFAALGTISTIREFFFPETKFAFINLIPPFPWYVWTIAVLILLFAFSIEGGYRVQDKLRNELIILNTPSVSIKLHNVDADMNNVQTVYLEITGEGVEYVRPEVFAMPAEKVGEGNLCLSMAPGEAIPFGLRRPETFNIAAIVYNPHRHVSLHVELPCKKITSEEYLVADHFRLKVVAFVGSKPAELEFEFGVKKDLLWARNIGASEISHVSWRPHPDLG